MERFLGALRSYKSHRNKLDHTKYLLLLELKVKVENFVGDYEKPIGD